MADFIERVRNGMVPQPTQPRFSREIWSQEFEKLDNGDSKDADLYEAGLFFDEALGVLRRELAKGHFDEFCRSDRLIALCALINHDVNILRQKVRNRPNDEGGDQKLFSINEEIGRLITLPSGIKATPDQIITSAVDSVIFPLDVALSADNEGKRIDENFDADMHRAFVVANAYQLVSSLWGDCLWGDRKVERASNGEILIVARNPQLLRQLAISEHRHLAHLYGLSMQAVAEWRSGLTPLTKRNLTIQRAVTKYDPKARKNPFLIGRTDNHRRRKLPAGVLDRVMATEIYVQSFFESPFPDFPNLTLHRLFDVWEVLGTLVRAYLKQIPEEPDELSWLFSHALRITRDHISDTLRRSIVLDDDTISEVIQFLTYAPRSGGLWQMPLIPLGEDEFLVAAGPVLYGSLLRVSERWLAQGGYDMINRGPIFERYARERISEMLEGSRALSDTAIASSTVFVGPEREEIDVLLRIGNLVLVGEAKCQLQPHDPIELYRYRRRLKEGAAQALRKAHAVTTYTEDVRAVLHAPEGVPLTVVPFVLSNSIIGSGYPIDGVAVVDLLYLGTLLGRGGLRRNVVLNSKGQAEAGSFMQYYGDQHDAEQRIPDLLLKQPVVEVFHGMLRQGMRPVPIGHDIGPVLEVYFSVATGGDGIDFERPAPRRSG